VNDLKLDISRLENVKPHGSKTRARCPACAENGGDASGDHLSISADGRFGCVRYPGTEGAEHRRRIFALAGTGAGASVAVQSRPDDSKLKSATHGPSSPDAATLFNAVANSDKRLVGRWPYHDAAGRVLFEVGRYELPEDKKTYLPVRCDADGWRACLPVGKLPLYGLPAVLASDAAATVYVCEGESCADAVRALGAVATCSQGGAGASGKTDWTALSGREVIILPDNDLPGEKYAASVADILKKLNAHVRIAALPGLAEMGEGADVVNWLDERDAQEPDALLSAIASAPATDATATPTEGGDAVDAAAWLSEPDEPELPIVSGLFDHGDRVSIVGQSKARKSFFAMQLAVSISTGTPFLHIETVTARVLLVNGEIRPGAYRKRLRRMLTAMQLDGGALHGQLLVLNSCDATAAATWESVLAMAKGSKAEVVIVDPAYLLLGDEIDQMQAKENVQSMRAFAAAGVTLVNVYHGTKGFIGDRQVIDRVAGSGVYARDASTMLSLCEHATEPDHVVLAAVTRNHPPQDARTLVFQDGAFTVADDVASIEKTSKTRAARKFDLQSVANCLPTGDGMKYGQAADRIRDRLAIGLNKAKELLGAAVESGHVEMLSVGTRTEYRKRESV
jgi:hypothetical protein